MGRPGTERLPRRSRRSGDGREPDIAGPGIRRGERQQAPALAGGGTWTSGISVRMAWASAAGG
jgi:hypothetical protein